VSRTARALLVISLVAVLHAGVYVVHQRPDWSDPDIWADQGGYRRLGWVLATTGRFTRSLDPNVYLPESMRTPGYPAFLALVYAVAGFSQTAVAVAQGGVFVAICLLVYGIGAETVDRRTAIAAAAVAALYSPFPYFGALALTELWTAFALTLSVWLSLRAVRTRVPFVFALAGVALGVTALSRPAFALLPLFIVAAAALTRPKDEPARRFAAVWATLLAGALLTLAPWLAYNAVHFGRVTMSPAGSFGRAVWEGYWNGMWPGRVQAALTRLAEGPTTSASLETHVRALAAETGADPAPMLAYVREWRALRRAREENRDPRAAAAIHIASEREYLRVGLAHVAGDLRGYAYRRVTRGGFAMWVTDIPVRYSLIDRLPVLAVRAMWLAQAVLTGLAISGTIALARQGARRMAALLVTPIVYVTLVHLPLYSEARYALPAKPVLLLLATAGAAALLGTLNARRD
jgi:4-amino-4-deoxy-L-arabinose transferase-like glycosyltransferase